MTQQFVVTVDPTALDALIAEVRALRQEVQAAKIEARPQWLTVRDFAANIGRSVSTVNRWIAAGSVETRMSGKVRLVKS